jgi:hypothetical protein
MRSDGLPIDIDIRVLQARKLCDGRLLVFRPLNRTARARSQKAAGRTVARAPLPITEQALVR